MRLRLWHKMIFIICVLSVFVFSFAVSSGASSYFEGEGDVVYQPLFFPNTMTLYSVYPETICYDMNTSICVDSDDRYFSQKSYTGLSDYTLVCDPYCQDTTPTSNYGYSYIDVSYVLDLPIYVVDYYDRISFTFPDLYLTSTVLGNYNFFGSLDIYYGDEDDILITSYYCSWNESYIDENGDFHSVDRFTEFTQFKDLIYYYDSDFPYGVFLSNIKFYIELDTYTSSIFSNGAYISGGSPCTSIDNTPSALFAWSEFYQPTTIITTPPPLTILESIQAGLDAVWNTSIFGLFTIGTVFSACAGVSLFAWLLKIFNR